MLWTIAQFRAEYADADALQQEVQNFRNEAGIPAMNELRNAGYHFLKALNDHGGLIDQDHLDNAVGHARRANYEATEAGIVIAVATVKKFQDDYATIEVSDLVPDYAARCVSCHAGLRLIENGRQAGFDRNQDHKDRIDVFRIVRSFAEDLVVARVEANKRVSSQRRDTRRFIITVVLTIAAIVIGGSIAIIIG